MEQLRTATKTGRDHVGFSSQVDKGDIETHGQHIHSLGPVNSRNQPTIAIF